MIHKKQYNVLVLGGSSDIGIEVTKQLLNLGWNVSAHSSSNLRKLSLLKNKFSNLKLIKMNFAKFNQQNYKKLINQKFKNEKFDSIVNLVGYIDNKTFYNSSFQDITNSLKINTIAPILIVQNFVNYMIKNKWGRILNCSSIGVKFGGGYKTYNYSLSKHLLEFIPNIHKQWAKNNVFMNNLRIGVCNTKIHKKINKKNLKKRINLIPIGRMAESTEIAKFIIYLITNTNTYITGQTLSISGGE